jgi:hypothetical protein
MIQVQKLYNWGKITYKIAKEADNFYDGYPTSPKKNKSLD